MTLDGASCRSQVTRAIFAAHQYRTHPKEPVPLADPERDERCRREQRAAGHHQRHCLQAEPGLEQVAGDDGRDDRAAAAQCATPIVPSSMRDFGKRGNGVLLVNAAEELNQLGHFFFCETRFEPLLVLVDGALGDCERAASRFRKVQRLLASITS